MKNKTIIAGLAGGVAFFLLGWIIYGMLLKNFMDNADNFENCAMRPEAEWRWWALILSNFVWGFLLAVILAWANTKGFGSGMQRGLLIGLLMEGAFDLGMYSMSNMFKSMNVMIVDIAVIAIMCGIVGGIIGMIIDPERGKPATT